MVLKLAYGKHSLPYGEDQMTRNYKKNPITAEELMHCMWYVVENDLIGGWSISNVNKPESQRDPYAEEFEIGLFITKAVAEHVVFQHNRWWGQYVDSTYEDNFYHELAKYYAEEPLTEDAWFDYSTEHEAT